MMRIEARAKRMVRSVGAAACGVLVALSVGAQTPARSAAISIAPRYTPGASYTYTLQIDSHILRSGSGGDQPAELVNTSEVLMRVLPVEGQAASNRIELKFLKYQTAVRADATMQVALSAEATASDKAALAMKPVEAEIEPDRTVKILSPEPAGAAGQAFAVLQQFSRTDMLPMGPVRVGDTWTRERVQKLPTMKFSLPLAMSCQLTGETQVGGQEAAEIRVHLSGEAPLPADALPNSQQLAAAGFVAQGKISIDGTSRSQYRVKDGLLLSASSTNHTVLNLNLVGASAAARKLDTTVDSTGTVKLISEKAAGSR